MVFAPAWFSTASFLSALTLKCSASLTTLTPTGVGQMKMVMGSEVVQLEPAAQGSTSRMRVPLLTSAPSRTRVTQSTPCR